MYCLKCGNKLDDGDKFCHKCGFSAEGTSDEIKAEEPQQADQPKKSKKGLWIGIGCAIAATLIGIVVTVVATSPTGVINPFGTVNVSAGNNGSEKDMPTMQSSETTEEPTEEPTAEPTEEPTPKPTPVKAQYTAYINGGFKGADVENDNGKVIAHLENGSLVNCIESRTVGPYNDQATQWKIECNGVVGWVWWAFMDTDLIGLTENVGTENGLNLRSGPGTQYSAVTLLPYYSSVKILSFNGQHTSDGYWAYVQSEDGYTGYVVLNYLMIARD